MKILKSLTLSSLLVSPTLSLLACHQNVTPLIDKNNQDAALQAVLWGISAERKAQMLTQYGNNINLYDKVISKQKKLLTQQGTDISITDKIKTDLVEWNDNKLTVTKTENNEFIPVVAVDLDETFLDNSPSFAHQLISNQDFDPLVWTNWILTKQAAIFAGVLEFVNHVYCNGGLVVFVSNRLHKEHLEATRQNLIAQGYPEQLTADFAWWLLGKQDHDGNVLTEKEARYDYLDNNLLSIANETVKVKIVMVVGDDINDFNSHLTHKNNHNYRQNYINDTDIEKLFGKVAPKIRFLKDGNKITKYYANCGQNPDDSLLKNGFISAIKSISCSYSTYSFIGGNAVYGGWYETFKLNNQLNLSNARHMKREVANYLQKFKKWY